MKDISINEMTKSARAPQPNTLRKCPAIIIRSLRPCRFQNVEAAQTAKAGALLFLLFCFRQLKLQTYTP
jgi:hypothetical protein